MSSKLKDLPKHQLPREKLISLGPANLKNHELIAILLRTGTKEQNVLKLSENILNKFPLKKLLDITYEDLLKISGINSAKATTILAAFELTNRYLVESVQPIISTSQDAINQLKEISDKKQEYFISLTLDGAQRLIAKRTITIGTLNVSLSHPREVYADAITDRAAGIIVAHNHPSNTLRPSDEDLEVTKRLIEAGKIIGIPLLDHIILTKDKYFSFTDNGLIKQSGI